MARRETELASHEREQLLTALPLLADKYEEQAGEVENGEFLSNKAEVLRDAETLVSERETIEGDMWDDIVLALNDIDEMDIQWLRAKLARRTGQNPILMGFGTAVPVGYQLTGEEPVYPDTE